MSEEIDKDQFFVYEIDEEGIVKKLYPIGE
jgi:hypothetical protein